jgi:hypothetical protein
MVIGKSVTVNRILQTYSKDIFDISEHFISM